LIRVLVAASSSLIRAGLEALVRASPALELAGSEADITNLAAAIDRGRPDVTLADLEFPLEEPPAELLSPTAPASMVLLVSNPGAPWIADALRAGVRSILPRDAAFAEITAAIEAAAAGLVALHPADLNTLLIASRPDRTSMLEGREALTPRELDVFAMLAEGAANKTIAWRLGISEHTVKFHVASIMSKLNAASRTEAVAIGIRRGLIML
jgi:NarL family two-component system response regulator YdfI